MPFDPKAFISATQQTKPAQAFDPKMFIAATSGQPESVKVSGELGLLDQAKLSFASNPEEEQGALEKWYPGAKFAQVPGADEKAPERVVQLPGEENYKYFNQPGFTAADLANKAGMVPAVAGGLIASPTGVGQAIGAGLGEVARKSIGRGLFNIPNKQSGLGNVADVGLSAATAGLFQKGFNKLFPIKPKITAPAAEAVAKETPQILPKSTGELLDLYKNQGSAAPKYSEIPSAGRLEEVQNLLADMKFKPLPLHKEMLSSRGAADVVRAAKEAPGEVGQALNWYDAQMKGEATQKLSETIGSLGTRPKVTAPESGEAFIKQIGDTYEANKASLSPIFEKFKNAAIPKQKFMPDLRLRIAEAIPGLEKQLVYNPENQKLILGAYSPTLGITRGVYKNISDTVSALNKKTLTFSELQNLREYLRQSLDPVNTKATAPLSRLRKGILDHMQDVMEMYRPDLKVRDSFKKYAVNEQNLEHLETIIGGKIDSFDPTLLASSDKILDRIFSSTKNTKIVKNILGDKEFENLAGDYLNNAFQKATDKNTFSSAAFSRFLKQKDNVLKGSLSPLSYERIKSLTDLMRILPDMPPVNPSGTAKTLNIMKMLGGAFNELKEGNMIGMAKGLIRDASENSQGKEAIKKLDELMRSQKSVSSNLLKDRFKKKLYPAVGSGLLQSTGRGMINKEKE